MVWILGTYKNVVINSPELPKRNQKIISLVCFELNGAACQGFSHQNLFANSTNLEEAKEKLKGKKAQNMYSTYNITCILK